MHNILLDSHSMLMAVDWPFRNRVQGIFEVRLKSSDSQAVKVDHSPLDSVRDSTILPWSSYTHYFVSRNHPEALVPSPFLEQVWLGIRGLYDTLHWSRVYRSGFLHKSCISISLHISAFFCNTNIRNLYRSRAILEYLQHQLLHRQSDGQQLYDCDPISHFLSFSP